MASLASMDAVRRKIQGLQLAAADAQERAELLQEEADTERHGRERVTGTGTGTGTGPRVVPQVATCGASGNKYAAYGRGLGTRANMRRVRIQTSELRIQIVFFYSSFFNMKCRLLNILDYFI
ncbi:Tropomyosin alpha-4 chain [Liparis tanakae]|uniref:Tropomyosin alpha-4 chain n=1 Tax=Liparis tanakae TaxID=230148 RepID=A0A4Z2E2C7_9TELE|nr:Tropomyosin alpha-4 chain [Liparis tanakae]